MIAVQTGALSTPGVNSASRAAGLVTNTVPTRIRSTTENTRIPNLAPRPR